MSFSQLPYGLHFVDTVFSLLHRLGLGMGQGLSMWSTFEEVAAGLLQKAAGCKRFLQM